MFTNGRTHKHTKTRLITLCASLNGEVFTNIENDCSLLFLSGSKFLCVQRKKPAF